MGSVARDLSGSLPIENRTSSTATGSNISNRCDVCECWQCGTLCLLANLLDLVHEELARLIGSYFIAAGVWLRPRTSLIFRRS